MELKEEELEEKILKGPKDRAQKIRKLKFSKDVTAKIANQPKLEDVLKKKFDREYSDEKLKATYTIASRFGFYEDEMDKTKLISQQAASIAGVYFDEDETLYVVGDPGSKKGVKRGSFNRVLIHELTHALQDQNFPLLRECKTYFGINTDRGLGCKALIEGDASFTELLEYVDSLPNIPTSWIKDIPSPSFEKIQEYFEIFFEGGSESPSYLALNTIFPYVYGENFVLNLWKKGGLDAVDKAFSVPPKSTEQILHFEKYFPVMDNPSEIEVPPLEGESFSPFKLLVEDTMGEFNMFLMFKEQYLPVEKVVKITEGWDGDRYRVYENESGDVLLLWFTVWDTEDDAQEFFDGYRKFLVEKNLSMDKVEDAKSRYFLKEGSEIYYGEKKDASVAIVEGAEDDNAQILMELVWKSRIKE